MPQHRVDATRDQLMALTPLYLDNMMEVRAEMRHRGAPDRLAEEDEGEAQTDNGTGAEVGIW